MNAIQFTQTPSRDRLAQSRYLRFFEFFFMRRYSFEKSAKAKGRFAAEAALP
jgi:hypothetical protein